MTQTTTTRSVAMTIAVQIQGRRPDISPGVAQQRGWACARLLEGMQAGKAVFAYVKADSSVRHAVGTTNLGMFNLPEPASRTEVSGVIRYWDFEAQGWRSFCADRLILSPETAQA